MSSGFLGALVLVCVLAAQAQAACGLQSPETFASRLQGPDGCWTDIQGRAISETPKPRFDSELRTTSLMLLALLGDGSTLRSGPNKLSIKRGVSWMRKRIDSQGRIALRSDPAWFTDHALATFTLAEATRLSKYRTLSKRVTACSRFLQRYLENDRVTVTPEMLLWSRALVGILRGCPRQGGVAEVASGLEGGAAVAAEITVVASGIEQAILRRGKKARPPEPENDLERAIELWTMVRYEKPTSSVLEPALDGALELRSMIDTMDPLAVTLFSLSFYQRGGARWQLWQKALGTSIVKKQISEGVARGSWRSPAAETGPIQTTACYVLALECYYRYLHLGLFE